MENLSSQKTRPTPYRMPLIYTTVLITIIHICNIMAFKVISVFGLKMAFTGFFFTISFILTTALSESYGHKEAERTILMVLLGQSLLLLIVPLSVKLPSPNNQAISESYNYLFSGLWKVFFSSNIAVGLSYFFNSALNSKLKIWLLGRRKFTRFIFANGISKAILVFVSYPINFAGIMNWSEILTICINTWMFKMSIAVFAIYLVNPLVRLNHIIDHIDVYDIDTSYNPLRLYEERFQGINMYEK